MTSSTSMCELACQIVQKKLKEKQLEEEQAAKAQSWKLPVYYDNDDDEEGSNSLKDNIIFELPPYVKITPNEPVDSLSIGDEHLNTILATESDEFIKSCVENLVPNPSESKGKNECDVPAGFTTFSNVLFNADYDFDSGDDQSTSDEDFPKKIYSNPLFDEEINPMKIDKHPFNVESDLIESMPNHDSSITISSKIDSLFDEFAGELTLLKSIPPRIDKTDCYPEKETRFTKRLLYDNSSPRPPEEIVFDNSNVDIESFSPSHIPNKDRVNNFRNAISAHYLSHSSEYVAPLSIAIVRPWLKTIRYGETVPAKRTLKKSLLPPSEATKGGSSKRPTGSKTGHLKRKKESSSAMDSNPSQTSASTPVVSEMHKEDQQATCDPNSLGVTSEERAHPQLSSGLDDRSRKYTHDHTFTRTNPSVLIDKSKSTRDGSQTADTVSGQMSLVQSHIKTLEALPCLLNNVINTLNRFANILNAHKKDVPSAGKSTASPAEGEKNTILATKDAELANLVDHI
nr:hypothetical protein [Tanacetum cinerariifolium]